MEPVELQSSASEAILGNEKEDKESVRKLMKAYEEVELYLQNKLK